MLIYAIWYSAYVYIKYNYEHSYVHHLKTFQKFGVPSLKTCSLHFALEEQPTFVFVGICTSTVTQCHRFKFKAPCEFGDVKT